MPPLTRERIAFGGETSTGKTYAWMMIARHLPTARFFVVETDDGVKKTLEEFPDIKDRVFFSRDDENCHLPLVKSWDDFWGKGKGVSQIKIWADAGAVTQNDWVIIEAADILYENLRYEFIERSVVAPRLENARRGSPQVSSWDVLIEQRKSQKPAIEPGDWDAINTEFYMAINYLVFQCPCNLIMTFGVEDIREPTGSGSFSMADAPVLRNFYHNMGMPVKFGGQKRLSRKLDSAVLFGKNLQGFNLQVYKWRGKNLGGNGVAAVATLVHKDFYVDVLKRVGWE